MKAFELNDIEAQHSALGNLYFEFLRVEDLSMGLYVLPVGGTDPQKPHAEDEVYYVVSGEATITVGDEERPVKSGSIVYVAAHVQHLFHSIKEELKVLVFFAPAEYSEFIRLVTRFSE